MVRGTSLLNRCRKAIWGAAVFFVLSVGAAAVAWAAPKPLLLVNAVYSPFVNPAGDPAGEGIDVEIAREALRRGGYSVEVRLVPWKRALIMLQDGEADFTTTISKNEDRERFLRFTEGYRNSVGYHFYSRKGSRVKVATLQDLNGLRLGVSSGFFYPDKIIKYPGVIIETGVDLASTIKKLEADRSDLIIVNSIAGVWEIRQLGLLDQLQLQPFTYSSDSPTYMAFSKAKDNGAAYEAMQRGLASMKKDGSLRRVEAKYLGPRR